MPEDNSSSIDPSRCTNPTKVYGKKNKIYFPSLIYRKLDSVKACLDAADWDYKIVERDGYSYKNAVLETSPKGVSEWDPESGETIVVTIASGHHD